jgi:hypothetical protein
MKKWGIEAEAGLDTYPSNWRQHGVAIVSNEGYYRRGRMVGPSVGPWAGGTEATNLPEPVKLAHESL